MRFHVGPIPEDPHFNPEGDGWVRLREPRPGHLFLAAVPLGMLLAVALVFVWSLIVRFEAPADSFSVTVSLPSLLTGAAALGGFVLLHETLHALPALVAGSSDAVIVGFWPRHLAPYMAYTGALTREVQLVSGATPFILLTLLPIVVAVVLPAVVWWMIALSVLNVLGSAADLIMLLLLIRQVPPGAVIQNQGFATWWRFAV